MKAHIPLNKKLINEVIRTENLKDLDREYMDIDTMILFTLHKRFGFGRVRLLRFARSFIECHKFYKNRYDDAELYAMRMELNKCGVCVERLEKIINEQNI